MKHHLQRLQILHHHDLPSGTCLPALRTASTGIVSAGGLSHLNETGKGRLVQQFHLFKPSVFRFLFPDVLADHLLAASYRGHEIAPCSRVFSSEIALASSVDHIGEVAKTGQFLFFFFPLLCFALVCPGG